MEVLLSDERENVTSSAVAAAAAARVARAPSTAALNAFAPFVVTRAFLAVHLSYELPPPPLSRCFFSPRRRQELLQAREKHKEEQVIALKHSMQSGMAMKEQAQLREKMAYQYKLGNFERQVSTRALMPPPRPSNKKLSRDGWLKFDELGKEILSIALPAALALAADPLTSLIDIVMNLIPGRGEENELEAAKSEIQSWHSSIQNEPCVPAGATPEPKMLLDFLQTLKSSEEYLREQVENNSKNPVLISGCKVADGSGVMLDLPTESGTVIPYVHLMKQAHKILRTVI
ncbi:hypothetical protein HN51_026203 [Arachis hypogaea]